MRCIGFLVCGLLLFAPIFAQAPDTAWTKTHGGTEYDVGNEVEQTPDGGYIIVGETESFGAITRDIYFIKTDASGNILWTKYDEYDWSANWDRGFSLEQTADGGYIIAGDAADYINDTLYIYLYLVKTNAAGDTLWRKIHMTSGQYDGAWSVKQTPDSGYIIAGDAIPAGPGGDYQLWLLKTNANGDTLWTQLFGRNNWDNGYSVDLTFDGGCVVAGRADYTTGPNQRSSVYLIRTDTNGGAIFDKKYGGAEVDYGFSVQQTADSGFIVAGYTYSYGPNAPNYSNVYLIKTDIDGNVQWEKTYGDTTTDIGRSVKQTPDGGYIVVGETGLYGSYDVFVVRTDANGDTLWTKTIIKIGEQMAYSVDLTSDGGYIIVGRTRPSIADDYDVWLIKLNPDVGVEEENCTVRRNRSDPTIISGPLLLPEGKRCRIFDVTGRVVAPEKMKLGVYFIQINGKIARKVIKIR